MGALASGLRQVRNTYPQHLANKAMPAYYVGQEVNRVQDAEPKLATIAEIQGDQILLSYSEGGEGWWPIGYIEPLATQSDYEGLSNALDESSLLDVMANKLTPAITISDRQAKAQAGGSNSLTLNTLASSVDDAYLGCLLLVTSATGVGETFVVSGYVGATRVATLRRLSGDGTAFTLDATTRYRLYSLEEFRDGLLKVANVFSINSAWNKLQQTLNTFIVRGDRDSATAIARFQNRIDAWVTAVAFNTTQKAELQALLTQYCPARSYTVT